MKKYLLWIPFFGIFMIPFVELKNPQRSWWVPYQLAATVILGMWLLT